MLERLAPTNEDVDYMIFYHVFISWRSEIITIFGFTEYFRHSPSLIITKNKPTDNFIA